MSKSMETNKIFNRCNISEDLIKRFSRIDTARRSGAFTTSPTGTKAALEQILLSVQLDADLANFSDTGGDTGGSSVSKVNNLPLYDTYESSFCLPSSGYRSDSETKKYPIRTCNSANQSPNRSPNSVRRANVRRTQSLNANTVTDRIWEIREKLAKSKKGEAKAATPSTPQPFEFRNNNSQTKIKKQSSAIRRARSFNTHQDIGERELLPIKNNFKSSISHIKPSDIETLRHRFGSTIKKQSKPSETQTTSRSRTTSESAENNTSLRSKSFSALQGNWESREIYKQNSHRYLNISGTSNQKSLSDVESNDIISHRKERRRIKRANLLRNNDRSDSETEGEENQLTQAALLQLERQNRLATRRISTLARRRARLDSDSNDENNNETSSDKTLDSGVYEITLSNLSENISKLSKRYDSDEFILDDCLSPKSGYSSATESLAESTTTFYDSTEEDMDNRKKRSVRKTDKTNAKAAMLNATRLKTSKDNPSQFHTSSKSKHSTDNTTLPTHITKSKQDEKSTNKKAESPTKINSHTSIQNQAMKGLNEKKISDDETVKEQIKKQISKDFTPTLGSQTQESNLNTQTVVANKEEKTTSSKVHNRDGIDKTSPHGHDKTIDKSRKSSTTQSFNRTDRKLSGSPNKAISLKSPTKEQSHRKESINQTQRKESIHHRTCCSGAENMSNIFSTNTTTSATSSMSGRRKSSVVGPAKQKDIIQHKTAEICLSTSLSKTAEEREPEKHADNQDKDNQDKIDNAVIDENLIKNDAVSTDNNSININHDKVYKNGKTKLSSTYKNIDDEGVEMEKKIGTKFYVNRLRSSIDETNSRNRLLKQGDSIALQISLDNPAFKSKLTSQEDKPKSNLLEGEIINPKSTNPSPIKSFPERKSNGPAPLPKPKLEKTSTSSLDKGVQCLLLTGETELSGQVINVSDTSKRITINDDILQDLGSDILHDIQFTYPQYLLTATVDSSEATDEIDYPDKVTVNEDPLKLKMENTRLQQLLFEVEKARSGTVKALLHVNTLLNKVQGENIRLEGEMKVCTQEKEMLTESLKHLKEEHTNEKKDQAEENSKERVDSVDRSLSVIVDSWKKEKKELLVQLNKTKTKEEEAEKSASRLRVQYKKVKEQLEHSNNAFTMTLKNNLEATKRMEIELKSSLNEKQELLKKCTEGNKYERELKSLQQEMEEFKMTYEELEDEKEQLEEKVRHLEKQEKRYRMEEEELHEQIGHSQEIIEKLTDVEEELKDRLQREMKDKEYLQECLDETGQILYQLKNNEKKLLNDKDILLDDLEAELEEKESLQTTLSVTRDEHKGLVDRLQNMTNIHINVRESLQQANKKEKNYQEQIEALTKTNHILHYMLEKEKEERLDLQEMFDIIESNHRKFKSETMLKTRDLESKCDELTTENYKLVELKNDLDKKCEELTVNLEQETEENEAIRNKLSRMEQLKESIENELDILRNDGEETTRSMAGLSKHQQGLEIDLKSEKQRSEKLTCTLEETEEMLEKVSKEFNEVKVKLDEYQCDYDDMQGKLKERHRKIRDLESNMEEITEQRDKYQNRMTYYESETKQLRKKVNEQTEEIGTLKIDFQRCARERDTNKRNCDIAVRDFEEHKEKCTATLRRLKEEIVDLGDKISEKDRLSSKQKENYKGQIDNAKSDLQFLRNLLDGNVQKRGINKLATTDILNESNVGKYDVDFLRKSHDKFRDEFQSHVEKLEGMLKESKENTDTVTVVQSPMSKIKLEELKSFRNEVFDLHEEISTLKTKFASLSADVTSLKFDESKGSKAGEELKKSLADMDSELSKLNELLTKIECRHKAVMSRNAILLQKTLTEDDLTAKDLVKKFQVVSLESENKQLRTLLGILKKRYDFNEREVAEELQKANQTLSYTNGTNGNLSDSSEQNISSPPSLPRKNMSPRTDSNLRYPGSPARQSSRRLKNHNSLNDTEADNSPPPPRKYNRDLHLRSSGVSSYSSDEDEDDYSPPRGLPKRYSTGPTRSRRPRN